MTPKSLLAPARLAGRPVLRSQSDERLVDLARAGSEPAFEAIVARYRAPLLRYCRRILPEARAEDAVQQAFVSAFAALRRDDAHLDLRPWLYRIAHNTALNVLRDRGLRHAELEERLDGVERPDQAMERRQRLREVVAAVKALPERQRDAVLLREFEGRSYDEIAVALGVTGGAVRQLLNRARATLRAGVTAVTPLPLMVRLCSAEGEPTAARVGELVGAGGTGALVTKVAATALVTGAVAGGIVATPGHRDRHLGLADPPAATASEGRAGEGSEPAGRQHSAGGSAAADTLTDTGGERGDSGGDDQSGGDDGSGSGERRDDGHARREEGSVSDDHHPSPGGSGSQGPGTGGGTGTAPSHEGSGSSGPGGGGSGSGDVVNGTGDGHSGSSDDGTSTSSSGPDGGLSGSDSPDSGTSTSSHGETTTTESTTHP
jgi:RNA polymerase sigma factor (sigma-70 family)